jgi:hypothetical protein
MPPRNENGRFVTPPRANSLEWQAVHAARAECEAESARLARLVMTRESAWNRSLDLSEPIREKEQEISAAERRAPQNSIAILLGEIEPTSDPLPSLRSELETLQAQKAEALRIVATLDRERDENGNLVDGILRQRFCVEDAKRALDKAVTALAVASSELAELFADTLATWARLNWLVEEMESLGLDGRANYPWCETLISRHRATVWALGSSFPFFDMPPPLWGPALAGIREGTVTELPKIDGEVR